MTDGDGVAPAPDDDWLSTAEVAGALGLTATTVYRLIDQDAVNVVVPYDPEAFASLASSLREAGRLTRGWIHRARRHTVGLYRPKTDHPVWRFLQPAPAGRNEVSEDWFLYIEPEHYDRELLGLLEAPDVWIA